MLSLDERIPMSFETVLAATQKYFPVKIKYKDEDTLMKIIGALMFFNKAFMTNFITTLGYTIYFPSRQWVVDHDQDAMVILIHEAVHMQDEKKYSILFQLGYIFPLWLSLLVPFLLFVLSWKIVLPLALFFLLPLPAPFRMMFERKAYIIGVYAAYKLYGTDPFENASYYSSFFKDSSYYWMWILGVNNSMMEAASRIKQGIPPIDDVDTMKMVDKLIEVTAK
jgi:hypothetical protein